MPAKRRVLERRRLPSLVVTPEQLAAWRACKAIRNKNSDAFKRAERELQLACGLSKFESPIGRYSLIGDATNVRHWAAALEAADKTVSRE